MHGVLKVRTSEEKAKAQKLKELEKIDSYNKLVKSFEEFKEKQNGKYNDESLLVSKSLLIENPEYYSIWNFRRNVIIQFSETKENSDLQIIYQNEMKFIEECIQRFSKSYWIWFHRQWVALRMEQCDWQRELKLCTKLLNFDLRNFHCWGHRRFVLKNSNIELTDELKYTTEKIEQNFSNYSAWHQRSSIIPKIYKEPKQLLEKILEEFELVRNAVYTEPKDSSSWIYHKWLVATIKSIPDSDYIEVLKNELSQIYELIELEPDCKWPIYTTLLLKIEIGGYDKNELLSTINQLIKLDPDHKNYYSSIESKI